MLDLSSVAAHLALSVREGNFDESDFELVPSHSLAKLTTFHTGGNAAVLFPKKAEVISSVVPFLHKNQIPFFVLGNGSNVIARDEGYDGLILSLAKFKESFVEGDRIFAQSGASVTALAALARKHALSGMEFFYGIPGTVGGAVFMNAGAYGGECRDVLEEVTFVTPEGKVETRPASELKLSYRSSVFEENGAVILSAVFRLTPGDPQCIARQMEDFMNRRTEKQPLEYPSAGSVFKRCEGRFTAQMIDEAGLKGERVGGAMVSTKHAGFIINYDGATSTDIFRLIDRVKEVIWEKERIRIECEVRTIE